jgi:hypothetical protein
LSPFGALGAEEGHGCCADKRFLGFVSFAYRDSVRRVAGDDCGGRMMSREKSLESSGFSAVMTLADTVNSPPLQPTTKGSKTAIAV